MYYSKLLKLNNRIHILDVLIIISLVLVFTLFIRFFTQKHEWIRIIIKEESVQSLHTLPLKIEDFEANNQGEKIAIIKQSHILQPQEASLNKSVIVVADIKTTINQRTGEREFKNRRIKNGSPIELNLKSDIISGFVINTASSINTDLLNTRQVTFHLYNQKDWLVQELKQKISNHEHAESISLLSLSILDKSIGSREGTDLILKTSVSVATINETPYYWYSVPLTPGTELSFYIQNILIRNAVIVAVE